MANFIKSLNKIIGFRDKKFKMHFHSRSYHITVCGLNFMQELLFCVIAATQYLLIFINL